ncbi:MAG: endonuclease Q family protein [Candidatus Pacearchaeota archaeon]|nr:endonuclease Q family protein [Candidatus Pacearchaeota archaeon]
MDINNFLLADLHIHSKYSRACSKDLSFETLSKWAKIKGLNLLGTGDFTHPIWIEEIKKLKPNNKGLYYYNNFPFIITGEISLIYTQERGRKVHLVLLVPDIKTAEKINTYLDTKGRRDYDGRPIFKISCEQFTKDMKDISKDIEVIPAHIWTPYFGVFGSMSGFDSLKEAFGNQEKNIHAIETGISSDPKMNLQIQELKNKTIVSFSDSHSYWPWRLGREATIFQKTDSYPDLLHQIRENTIIGTIEVDPAYGKYHWDGHANCNFSCSPQESKELNNICPKCGKLLRIGVENRIEELSTSKDTNGKIFYTILPLHEILSLHYKVGMASKKIWSIYNPLIEKFGNEFNILLNVSHEDLEKEKVDEKLIDLILKNREGKIKVKPGYDGEYGVAKIEEQKKLF